MPATERITVLLSTAKKRRIARRSKAAGLSMGEFLLRAADSFRSLDDDAILEGMIVQMNKSTAQASAGIDRALKSIEASNARIARLER